jgi:hypothetical protein
MQQPKNNKSFIGLEKVSVVDKYHMNQTLKGLSFDEIKRELKILMKELQIYKSYIQIV